MSQQRRTTLGSMHDLNKIYQYNDDITESHARILHMTYNKQRNGTTMNKRRNILIENLQVRINRLTLMRHDELMRIYSGAKLNRNMSQLSPLPPIRPKTQPKPPFSFLPSLPSPSPSTTTQTRPNTPSLQTPPISFQINEINIKDNSIDIHMVPTSYKANESIPDDDIIYPVGVTDFQPYKIVARYRKLIGKSTNFCLEPLLVGDDSTETLVIGLDHFAQQHDCILSFTNEDQQFDQSIYYASSGVVNLGSLHLLATDSLLTANFQFEIDLDYENEFAQSEENIRKFVHDFCAAISIVLFCDSSNVRVFSINKLTDEAGKSQVKFGLTTPKPARTEQLAHKLQDTARLGFAADPILRHVIPRQYECTWRSVLKRLQIQLDDLDPRYNYDYRLPGVPEQLRRGNYPYYLPIGWYRHALNVQNKYEGSQTWLGCINAIGEWPVAFHGTHVGAVKGIIPQGLSTSTAKTDAMLHEAIEQIGEEANRPGLYVATHCNGGSHPRYTTAFDVPISPDKNEQFRIVFQCRVEPGKFTTHRLPVQVGEAWRIVDPKAVRPYGILLKKEDPTEEI